MPLIIILLFTFPVNAAGNKPYPQRIISTSPGITEILFALGAGERVVGVTDFCNYPPAARNLPKIGGLLNPNFERIISLKPDLVIHQAGSEKIENLVRKLKVASLPVTMLDFQQIFTTIQTIGEATGNTAEADRLIQKMKNEIRIYRDRLGNTRRKSVFIVLGVGDDPVKDLYGVGRNTFLGEILEIAGGENILSDTLAPYPRVSREFLMRKSPEVIIELGPKPVPSSRVLEKRKKRWETFGTLRAVQTGSIHFIGGDYILIPGPRLVSIIAPFFRAIHPELVENNAEPLEQAGVPRP